METPLAKRTWVEINPMALAHNLELCKEIAPEAEVMAVVKADAYGHGLKIKQTVSLPTRIS